MSKAISCDEYKTQMGELRADLKEASETVTKVIEGMDHRDVTFTALDTLAGAEQTLRDAQKAIKKIRSLMRARAQTRLSDKPEATAAAPARAA